jgi:hypothetical protein
MNLETTVKPNESQRTVSYLPLEGIVEDVMGCPECHFEVKTKAARTSI